MTVVKTAELLLLLLLAAVSIHADHHAGHHHHDHDHDHDHGHGDHHHHHNNHTHGPENCDGLNFTLPKEDMHKIYRDWVMVYSAADHQEGVDLLALVASSYLEFRLLDDNKTVTFRESNMYHNKTCIKFFINTSLDDQHGHMLHSVSAHMELDGTRVVYEESGHMDFFETCPTCLSILWTDNMGKYLMVYRLFGEHQDAESLKAARAEHQKLAECLGIPSDKPMVYDGAEFCHDRSTPEATEKPAES